MLAVSQKRHVLYLQLETKSLLRAPQVHMIVALNVAVSLSMKFCMCMLCYCVAIVLL